MYYRNVAKEPAKQPAKKKPKQQQPKDREPIVGSEVLTFREGKSWIAAWTRFDILTQGPTEKIAFERLLRTIACEVLFRASDGESVVLGNCPKPPEEVVASWRARWKKRLS